VKQVVLVVVFNIHKKKMMFVRLKTALRKNIRIVVMGVIVSAIVVGSLWVSSLCCSYPQISKGNKLLKYIAVVLVMFLTSACLDGTRIHSDSPMEVNSPTPENGIYFLTDMKRSDIPKSERAYEDAGLIGKLMLVNGCLGIYDSSRNKHWVVIWPPEYELSIDQEVVQIRERASGEILAAVGDEVRGGGGPTPATNAAELAQDSLPSQCTDSEYYVVAPSLKLIE